MNYQQFEDDELGLRDHLAIDRTAMANQRTFLAYARTSIMLAATAVTLFKLFPGSGVARGVAIALVPSCLLIAILGTRNYLGLAKALRIVKR